MSVLTKNQKKTYGPRTYVENGRTYRMTVRVRHDDECGNGHNSFSIVCDIDEKRGNNHWVDVGGGAAHGDIAKHFPELAPYIKWHLCDTAGPLHYVANTIYFVKKGDLDAARKSAIWPEAAIEDLTKENLEARLPSLLEEFRKAVESLGFTY